MKFNFIKYDLEYFKICPYTISDLELKFHLERRCELYNINNNSRYSHQYICSYNSEKENQREKKLDKKIDSNYVFCLKVKSLIKNNSIIDSFNKEYANSDKYYCCRANQPKDFSYVKHKDGNNKIKQYVVILTNLIYIFQMDYPLIYMIYLKPKINPAHFHRFDNPNDETKESEKSIRINSFVKEKTVNIIIKNKEIYTIKSDIKQFSRDNKRIIKNNNIVI